MWCVNERGASLAAALVNILVVGVLHAAVKLTDVLNVPRCSPLQRNVHHHSSFLHGVSNIKIAGEFPHNTTIVVGNKVYSTTNDVHGFHCLACPFVDQGFLTGNCA